MALSLLKLGLILMLGFLLRLIFGIHTPSTDSFVSLWHIKRQENNNYINYEVDDSLLGGKYSYPVLPHFILSFFQKNHWKTIGLSLNSFYDVLTALPVYFLTLWISDSPGILGLNPGHLASLLFLTSPILFPLQPRLKTIKGRTMGLLWNTLYFTTLFIYLKLGTPWILPVAIIIGLLLILTSMFGFQVLLFFSLVYTLITQQWIVLAVTVATIVLAIVLPVGKTRSTILFWLDHKIWYWRNLGNSIVLKKRRFTELFRQTTQLFTQFKRVVKYFVKHFSPTIAIYNVPVLWTVLYLIYVHDIPLELLSRNALTISLCSIVLFVITSLPYLNIFGQAERYFEYSSPFFHVLFSLTLLQVSTIPRAQIFWILLLYHLVVVLLHFIFLNRSKFSNFRTNFPPETDELVEWIKKNLENTEIATVPVKLTFLLSSTSEGNDIQFYFRFMQRNGERGFRYFEQDTGGELNVGGNWEQSFSMFEKSPTALANEYGIEYLVIYKKFRPALEKNWERDTVKNTLELHYENKHYQVYKIKGL